MLYTEVVIHVIYRFVIHVNKEVAIHDKYRRL